MLAAPGRVCRTSPAIPLKKNTANSFFLLKEKKRKKILEMFCNKGITFASKITFFSLIKP